MTNFTLIQDHGWRLNELDDMLPFEREIYTNLLNRWIEQRAEMMRARAAAAAH